MHFWGEPILVVVFNSFYRPLDLVCLYCVYDFYNNVYGRQWLILVFLSYKILVRFWCQHAVHIKWYCKYFFVSFLWKMLCKISIIFFLESFVGIKDESWAWCFFLGKEVTSLISFIDVVLFSFFSCVGFHPCFLSFLPSAICVILWLAFFFGYISWRVFFLQQ